MTSREDSPLPGEAEPADPGNGEWFPIWGVRLKTPRLTLEPLRESRFDEACELVSRGIHDPSWMPFEMPFTDTPSPRREQESIEFWLGCWAGVSPEGWRLPFAALLNDSMVGLQDLAAAGWQERRLVETGSWLGSDFQGQGFGREMRAAALHLAFEHLGARSAESTSFEDNEASRRVSEVLGYAQSGTRIAPRRGESAQQVVFSLGRAGWPQSAAADLPVVVRGVSERVRAQLGASPSQ
ncbi:MAG: GNAT family N-acetyltransferase [Microthrixaceae bacterium]